MPPLSAEISSLTIVTLMAIIIRIPSLEVGPLIAYVVFQFGQTFLSTLLILMMRHYGIIKEDDHHIPIARF